MQLPVELGRFYSARYLHLVQQVIRVPAARGRVIIMGRGAQVVLRNSPGCLHIRTVAPLQVRIRRVAREEGASEREATRRIRRRDGAVARYLRHYYRVDWGDPLLYHLILNTGVLTEEEAVRLVLLAAPTEKDSGGAPWTGAAEGFPSR